ncbi:chromosome segregation protein SMC [Halobaculum sp. CBA1158]|uniref:DUF7518 family protein n=1 Tax=Halobaculum sp. CBA1158 TaxID=2904243 RepID=UPI001F2A7C33|nr:chromosome segregation protein SMC [Halobaculum sp. CBA1158]UIP01187.1 chromosome segregation protein SMC [Halobaculum sp. CBA1158]
MGNRVDDLEAQVAELQAAVDGLTEELVEAKERISQLERSNAVEADPVEDHNPNAEFVPNESATAGNANGSSTGAADDGRVMADDEDDAQKAARGADGDGAEGADDDADSTDDDSDDIIVA